TFRPLPLSQRIRRKPVSSTPLTVPFVPAGGACTSSICTNSTRVPAGYSRRMLSTISLLGNFMVHTPILESRGPGQILQQDLALRFIFAADESQPQQKTAECVFLILHRFLSRCYPLGIPAHLTECGNEVGVGFDSIGIGQFLEPRKRHPVLQDFNGKLSDPQGFPYQFSLGFQQLGKITQRYLIERDFHCKPHVCLLWLGFTCFG